MDLPDDSSSYHSEDTKDRGDHDGGIAGGCAALQCAHKESGGKDQTIRCQYSSTIIGRKAAGLLFPVGTHGGFIASVTALYLAGEKKMWKAALVLAVLIALSRLYLYVHYPTDIIGGVVFGSLSGYLGYKIVEWIQKKKIK